MGISPVRGHNNGFRQLHGATVGHRETRDCQQMVGQFPRGGEPGPGIRRHGPER